MRPARVNVVLMGPPGSGKGTQAARIAERYGIPHISTGAILRAAVKADSPLGRAVKATIDAGSLVSDALMSDLVRERLAAADAARGFVLDGFPRTVVQAQALDAILDGEPLSIVLISVSAEEIIRRLMTRRVCESCGLAQSTSGGSEGEMCPYCGGTLVRRQDDDPQTVQHRLQTYAAFARPLIDYYRPRPAFAEVDGARHPDEVAAAVTGRIDSSIVR